MMPALYRFFLYPLAFLILQICRPLLGKKAKQMVADKNNHFFEVKNNTAEWIATQRPFWIHAASGEIEYARPVIRELKNKFPDVPVIVTFSSPSAKKIIKSLADVDAWGSLPWDFHKDCRNFIEKWQPRAWLVARTDVWPVMAEVCREKNIPSLLFAATFAENSSRLRGASAKITQWALNQLSEVHCVSVDDVKQLEKLQLQVPVHVHGDTRFDQVFYRLQHPKPLKNELRPTVGNAIFVAGSTWPEDEKVVLPAFAAIQKNCKMILAPHEIHENHLQDLERQLKALNLTFCKYSTATQWTNEDVLIIDHVGILAEIYTWGSVAFVGGSFRKQVHSVMEPLAAGLPVLVGPYHHNNREALVFKNKTIGSHPAVIEVLDSESLAGTLSLLILNRSAFPQALQKELSPYLHSSQSVVNWCSQRTH
jgi:3-deoxy-D-manno-octulosonic-acid transferase